MRRGEERSTRRLLDQIGWIEVTDEIAERAGKLAARYPRSHPGVEVVDYVIAATVEAVEGELVTLNRKHFPMFKRLEDPYSGR